MIRFIVKPFLYLAALGAGGALALNLTRETVSGSGVPATEVREVGDVTEVSLSGAGELVLTQGPVAALTVTADDNVLPFVVTESANGKLALGIKSGVNLRTKTKIAYALTVPRLEAVAASGATSVRAARFECEHLKLRFSGATAAQFTTLACRTLKVEANGAGTVTLTGTARDVTAKLSGATKLDAIDLKASTADVQTSGACDATVWVADDLKVRASGSGGVKYKGDPKVEQRTSGAAKVRPVS